MRTLWYSLLLALVACRPTAATQPVETERPFVYVQNAKGERIPVRVELALTDTERQQGLMHRKEMGRNDGMLFAFESERLQSFWMHNTLLSLDMVFIDNAGIIAGIVKEAAPLTDTSRKVGRPSRYVLEVNGGWCDANGVRAGDRVALDEALEVAERRVGKWVR